MHLSVKPGVRYATAAWSMHDAQSQPLTDEPSLR